MAKEHSLNRKEMIKEGIFKYQEQKKKRKYWLKTIDFPFFLFSKLCLMIESKKMNTLPKVLLNVCRGNI
jgi:hypothetical protein